MRTSRFLALAATALILSACGGSMSSSPTPSTFNLQAGFASLVTSGEVATVTLSGSVSTTGTTVPFTGSGTFTLSPSVAATFHSIAGVSQNESITGTVTVSGQNTAYSSAVTSYYSAGGLSLLGQTSATEFAVAQSPIVYPSMVSTGCSGSLGTLLRYTDSTQSVPLGTVQLTYACQSGVDRPDLVGILVTGKIYDTQGALLETDVWRYTFQSNGTLLFAGANAQTANSTLIVNAP